MFLTYKRFNNCNATSISERYDSCFDKIYSNNVIVKKTTAIDNKMLEEFFN